MSIIGSGANQLVVHGHLGSVAYFNAEDLPASAATQVAIDAAIAGLAAVARTGSYDDLTDKVPTATEQELAEGTEVGARLFSPKQLESVFLRGLHNQLVIETSQTIPRPTDGPMYIYMCGAGGGGATTGHPSKGGGSAAYCFIYVPSGANLPEDMAMIVPSGRSSGAGGEASLWGIRMGGGGGGTPTTGGAAGVPLSVASGGMLLVTAYEGVATDTSAGGRNPPFTIPPLDGFNAYGGGGYAGPYSSQPGVIVIFY